LAVPARLSLDLRQAHGAGKRPHGLDVDHAEAAARIGRIGIVLLDDFDDPDDLLFLDRVIEERLVAGPHGLEVVRGLVVAHAVPFGDAVAHLVLPRPGARLRFDQPIGHDPFLPGPDTQSDDG
jgi:hypothetical protein